MDGTTIANIILIVFCSVAMLIIVLYTIGYFLYNSESHPCGKFVRWVFHDVLQYHMPKDGTIREIEDKKSPIQYFALCKYCDKPIYMKRRNKKKWHEVKDGDEVYEMFFKKEEQNEASTQKIVDALKEDNKK